MKVTAIILANATDPKELQDWMSENESKTVYRILNSGGVFYIFHSE